MGGSQCQPDRGRHAEEQTAYQRQSKAVQQQSRIERHKRQYFGTREREAGEERERYRGHHKSRRATEGPDEQAFEQQLADDPCWRGAAPRVIWR